jgi:hypothetical protein
MKGRLIASIALFIAALALVTLKPATSDLNTAYTAPAYAARYEAVAQQVDVDALGTRVANLESFVDGQTVKINGMEKRLYALELLAYLTPTLAPTFTPAPATSTPQPTSTTRPTSTPTNTPTSTPTVAPSATPQPSATPPPHIGQGFDCRLPAAARGYVCAGDVQLPPATVPNLASQACPQWVHDQYLVGVSMNADGSLRTTRIAAAAIGNGVAWRTWHPAIDPATGCGFDHEHGDDPRLSKADSSWPAFGYEAFLANMTEPHFGFKVSVMNSGDINPFDGNRKAMANGRIVFHMGTSGTGRLTERMHSFTKVLRDAAGTLLLDVRGMADTGLLGNICQRDASLQLNSDPSDDVGRTLGQPDVACPKDQSYEIWSMKFYVKTGPESWDWTEVNFSMAAFDPTTVMTADGKGIKPNPVAGSRGCRRETYFGSVFLRSTGGAYMTDAFGKASTGSMAIRQFVSKGQGVIQINSDPGTASVFKTRETDYCTSFLGNN